MDSGPIEEGLTHVDVGCERRLFGLMQALLAARVGRDVDWEAKPPRGVVTEVDATEALLQVAMVIDEALGEQRLDAQRLVHAAACLMVARDYIRPLPEAPSARTAEPVSDDLREMVAALRQSYSWPYSN